MNEQRYPILRSKVEPSADVYRANREQNLASIAKLEAALAKSREGGGEQYNARHLGAGKLLPRQRIEMLVDRDAHFLELCALAGHGVFGHTVGASVVGGVGV